jgi:hypothetical protein
MNTVAEYFPDLKTAVGSGGSCSVDELMRRMNIIGPELVDMVDAKGMNWTWCLPIEDSCVVLPADIRTPQQAWINGESLGFRSEWWNGRLGGDMVMDNQQELPWREIIDTGKRVATQCMVNGRKHDRFFLVPLHREDAGTKVEVRYLDIHGRENIWTPTLKSVTNFNRGEAEESPCGVGELIRFHKPRTKGAVELWTKSQDFVKPQPMTGTSIRVAIYEKHEEDPEYRVMKATTSSPICGTLTVKGKKEWRPLRDASDLIPFGRIPAWKAALAAEAAMGNRQFQEMRQFLAEAVTFLDQEATGYRPRATSQPVSIITPWMTDRKISRPNRTV